MLNGSEFQMPANVNNPVVWIVALVLIMLLFGGQKLPGADALSRQKHGRVQERLER